MKTYFNSETIHKMLKLAALYNVMWGILVIVFPSSLFHFLGLEVPNYLEIWQCVGATSAIFGIGYYISSFDPEAHWPIILVGFMSKILVSIAILKGYLTGSLPLNTLSVVVFNDLIWIIPFYYALVFAYEANTIEDSAPKKFNDLIRMVKTNQGESLFELSEKKNVLLVFVRHFGCTFCRETVSEIAKLDESIKGKNLTPVFIHMSDLDFADEFFSRYYNPSVSHVSDPSRVLYKSLNLKRGTLSQVFGPTIWLRGFWAGIFKGHGLGAVEGDALQLGGYFILSRGQIVFEHKNRNAADFFSLQILPEF